MKRFCAFVAIGSLFATVEEFLTIVVLRHDIPSYLFTLIILFPAYLSLVFLSSRLIDRFVRREPARLLTHLLTYGTVGLLMEWFLMGLSPWSNPAANPLLMLGFQLGMFAFWATVSTAPRVFLHSGGPCREARGRIAWFFVPYVVLLYGVGLSVPEGARFATIILLVVFGYSVVVGLFIACIFALYAEESRGQAGRAEDAGSAQRDDDASRPGHPPGEQSDCGRLKS